MVKILNMTNIVVLLKRFFSAIPNFFRQGDLAKNVRKGEYTKFYHKYVLNNVTIGRYSYVGRNSYIDNTEIGSFCSIGPNFCSGLGIHPIDGISTSPCFYSLRKQCGYTFSNKNKIKESLPVKIGNDVFIGANVTILSGVNVGDGAVIGAGAVVIKDVLPYSIVGGVPAKHIRFRFPQEDISKLLKIAWWNWPVEELRNVDLYFDKPEVFINKFQT